MKSQGNCDETRELMPDLAAGLISITPEVKAHLDSCAECTQAGELPPDHGAARRVAELQSLRLILIPV